MAKVKLSDVAERAGVSKSTVSQFLNGRFDFMSKSTKARVQLAVDELNYVPNAIARSLKTNKTKTIGVIVRDIAGDYTNKAIRGIDDYCKSKGYHVVIYNTDFDAATEAESLQKLSHLGVDGIIIAPSGGNTDLIHDYQAKGLVIVQFQLEHDANDKNIVVSDYKGAAFEATEYLIGLGHERICFVTQDYSLVKSRHKRFLGYCEALQKHGLAPSSEMILRWDRSEGFNAKPEHLLKESGAPTAFFTQHLAITKDMLSALNEAKVNIPADVSLLGFDDVPMAQYFKVPLTVVRQSSYTIGAEAARLLLDILSDNSERKIVHSDSGEREGIESTQSKTKFTQSNKICIPCELVIRESCKALR